MTVYKTVDLVGTSATSVSDAIRGAIERAGDTIDDLQWFEVTEIRGRITENRTPEYQVKVAVGFQVHAPKNSPTERETVGRKSTVGTKQTRSAAAQVAAKRGEKGRSDLAKGFEKQQRSRK